MEGASGQAGKGLRRAPYDFFIDNAPEGNSVYRGNFPAGWIDRLPELRTDIFIKNIAEDEVYGVQ